VKQLVENSTRRLKQMPLGGILWQLGFFFGFSSVGFSCWFGFKNSIPTSFNAYSPELFYL